MQQQRVVSNNSKNISKNSSISLFEVCSNSIVVVQEIALSCYFLSRIHLATLYEQYNYDPYTTTSSTGSSSSNNCFITIQFFTTTINFHILYDGSTFFLFLSLVLILFYSRKAKIQLLLSSSSTQQSHLNTINIIKTKTKIQHRTKDSLLLGILLRFIVSSLQSLTASYSTDTVEILSFILMLIHILFCDYTYANGLPSNSTTDTNTTTHTNLTVESTTTTAPAVRNMNVQSNTNQREQRPLFLGGTVSLNAALFATTLLVSRLQQQNSTSTDNYDNDQQEQDEQSSFSTNIVTGYTFVTLAIIFFSFYPATRNTITTVYSTKSSFAMWLITGCICLSTTLLLKLIDEVYTNERNSKQQQQQQHQRQLQGEVHIQQQFDHRSYIYQFYNNNYDSTNRQQQETTTTIIVENTTTSIVLYFISICIVIGFIFPLWKYYLQQSKQQFCGPWDIPSKEYMQL